MVELVKRYKEKVTIRWKREPVLTKKMQMSKKERNRMIMIIERETKKNVCR